MKFDGFRHPREQVAPITLAGTFRNQPLRLLFYRNPFLGLFFTIGFILLPYVGHQLDKKGFAAARKDLMRQLDERKRSHSNVGRRTTTSDDFLHWER
ncbi:DNA-directed RNA polymerase subunit beta [Trichinella spiralis]|uniref:DNA-directed RNA polymerase subunit beta n=1 Tax=Trichinella spiralis TaxID=6334 RepID=A0ABR3K553_TRISP